ncbi:MAG TPA: FAD-binding oxidoreductase, partial [Thermoplasmata archaeon]|nr:FAD-binding oxidoreductase [Thermoplasmata archaeon]
DFGRPMSRLRPLEEGWEIETPTGTLSGRSLVVAAGAWSKAILRGIDHPMPLAPYRTQAAVLRVPGALGEEFPTVHELDSDVYVRPESEGRILAGDGTEETESDPERFPPHADQPFLEHLAATLSRRFPGWRESEVAGSWAGVCTATPDRRPIVGSLGGAPPLFVLTGFNGFGVMRAGGIARRLADLIAALPSAEESLAPVAPGRFRGSIGGFRPRPGFTVEGGDDPRY